MKVMKCLRTLLDAETVAPDPCSEAQETLVGMERGNQG